jgi:hypothetical protein
VGCLAERRFADPVLLEACEDGRTVALALFNRRRGRLGGATLWLGESGDAALDSVFVEHNGPLIERGREALLGDCLAAAFAAPLAGARRRSLVLSGVDATHVAAAGQVPGVLLRRAARPAPFVQFGRPGGYLDGLSANTRYQLRRSARAYAARGPLTVRRAATVAEGRAYLAALAGLHQASWTSRGQPGAFARPEFLDFHHALIARTLPDGETDLLRVSAGDAVIGYLYNFRFRGVVSAYQSGFDYAAAQPHQKPGLTCHHQAIEMYRAEGIERYDFLAGGDRYKTSLANAATTLHWVELVPRRSFRGVLAALRGHAKQNG